MNPQESLHNALDLSDQILMAIESQKLDMVSVLDEQRKVSIEQYYKNNIAIDADLTCLLKQKNDQIVTKLINMQQKIRCRKINLNRSQKVSKAYLANSMNDHR